MLATIKNYDILCYQLRNNLYPQLDNPLKKDTDQLSKDIRVIMLSGKELHAQSNSILGQIFNFRIKAIKWLVLDNNFNLLQKFNEIIPQIEKINSNKRLEVLAENLLFAIRCNQRVVESLLYQSDDTSAYFSSAIRQLPEITYGQFIASLAFAIPDQETTQKFIDWIDSSLHIEFGMVATDIIYNDNLKISDKTINELAFLIANAAQEYSALAMELGIIKSRASGQTNSNFLFDRSFIKEQQYLADLGIEDFAQNLSN